MQFPGHVIVYAIFYHVFPRTKAVMGPCSKGWCVLTSPLLSAQLVFRQFRVTGPQHQLLEEFREAWIGHPFSDLALRQTRSSAPYTMGCHPGDQMYSVFTKPQNHVLFSFCSLPTNHGSPVIFAPQST